MRKTLTKAEANNLKGDHIVIPFGYEKIGKSAFKNRRDIESIVIPDGVKSIGDYAFSACGNLNMIDVPDSVVQIGEGAFDNFKDLFICCSNPSFAFDYCRKNNITMETANEITIPDGATSIDDTEFCYREDIESIRIPESVEKIDGTEFDFCYGLKEINVDENNKYFSSMNGILYDKSMKTLISYPAGIESKFFTVPDCVTSIGSFVFRGCESLLHINLSSGVSDIGNTTFMYCTNLTSINACGENQHFSSINGVLFDKNKETLICHPSKIKNYFYSIPDGVKRIAPNAFWECKNLEDIRIPESVESIGNSAFVFCHGIKIIDIPCGVRSIDSEAFSCNENLTHIIIPAGVSSIDEGVVSFCDNLISIDVNECNQNYFSTDGVLFDKNKKTLICYPAGIDNDSYAIPDGVTSIGAYAFSACKNLINIYIPDSVANIGDTAFSSCENLKYIKIPAGVTSIKEATFASCKSLTHIIIPTSVTSIEDSAFIGCENLNVIQIPDSVTSIGEDVFTNCNENLTVYCSRNSHAYTYCQENEIHIKAKLSDKTLSEISELIADGFFHFLRAKRIEKQIIADYPDMSTPSGRSS